MHYVTPELTTAFHNNFNSIYVIILLPTCGENINASITKINLCHQVEQKMSSISKYLVSFVIH